VSDLERMVELAEAELSGGIRPPERKELAELVVRTLGPGIGRPTVSFAVGDATITVTGKDKNVSDAFRLIAGALETGLKREGEATRG
jgi:hypothetical protein